MVRESPIVFVCIALSFFPTIQSQLTVQGETVVSGKGRTWEDTGFRGNTMAVQTDGSLVQASDSSISLPYWANSVMNWGTMTMEGSSSISLYSFDAVHVYIGGLIQMADGSAVGLNDYYASLTVLGEGNLKLQSQAQLNLDHAAVALINSETTLESNAVVNVGQSSTFSINGNFNAKESSKVQLGASSQLEVNGSLLLEPYVVISLGPRSILGLAEGSKLDALGPINVGEGSVVEFQPNSRLTALSSTTSWTVGKMSTVIVVKNTSCVVTSSVAIPSYVKQTLGTNYDLPHGVSCYPIN